MKTCRVCQRSYPTHFTNCPQDGARLIQSEEWPEGTMIRGKYQIIRKIGQGAMGAVYKALHTHFQELRALKVIAASLSADKTFVKRFEQEAILTRKLQHPNAVRVDDIDETEDGQPFIVMEYIEGKNLRDVLSAEGPMAPARVAAIIRQVASALDAAHRLGIVHRDIKPENIVLIRSQKEEVVAKVLDFGIAKLKEELGGTSAASMTGTGMVVGTPLYMSPEQAMASHGKDIDGRSDIYSLGIVMYQMLTNELPIHGDTSLQIVLAHIQTPPIPIQCAQAGTKLPQPLADLVMKCLAKNREDRPTTGQAIVEELDRWEAKNREVEGETLLVAQKSATAKRPATLRSTQPMTAVPATGNRAGTVRLAGGGAPVLSSSTRSWLPWAVLACVAAIAVAGAWRYRGAWLRFVVRNGNFAAKSGASQPKTEPALQVNAGPAAALEKPVSPVAASVNASAENIAAPAAAPADSTPPPVAPKTKDYANPVARKVSNVLGNTAEQNEFKAVRAEKDETHQIQRLDEFVSHFPNSDLLAEAYTLYYRDYRELKNFQKVIEYSDKFVALGDKTDANTRFQALYARAIAYNALRTDDPAEARRAKEAAALGLRTLNEIPKPANSTDAAFAAERKPLMAYFQVTSGAASMKLKDYPGAVEAYRAALAQDPEDGDAAYHLGLAYLGLGPPAQLDAFWSLARAVNAKSTSRAQSQEIADYLRKLITRYEQTQCLGLVDTQVNELIQAAGNSVERTEDFKLPSKADLDAARNVMTIMSVVADLKGGGDKAKVTWLAACGMEFPNVPSKVIKVVPGDPIVLKVALVTSEQDFSAARKANMDASVGGQPEAGNLTVGSLVRFTGTLASYDQTPLMLHWQKARVNPQDVPATNK